MAMKCKLKPLSVEYFSTNSYPLVISWGLVSSIRLGLATRPLMVILDAAKHNQQCFSIVRFGNVLGSRGSVVPFFKRQIAAGGPVTVTHPDMERFFMTIPEAVTLVLQASLLGQGGEVMVLDMGEPILIKSIAEELIKLHDMIPGEDIEINYTGIRPGEKIFEEILTAEEGTNKTTHERIYVANISAKYDLVTIKKILGAFDNALSNGWNNDQIKQLITDALDRKSMQSLAKKVTRGAIRSKT